MRRLRSVRAYLLISCKFCISHSKAMESTFRQELAECEQLPVVEAEGGRVRGVLFPDGTRYAPIAGDVGAIEYPDGARYWGRTSGNSPSGLGIFETEGARVVGAFSGEELRGPGLTTGVEGSASGSFSGAQLSGYGAAARPDEGVYFAGEFRSGHPEGLGTLVHRVGPDET